MSNALRYDPLLVHYLAAELRARWAGAQVRELSFDPEERLAALVFQDEALVLDLHPARGWIEATTPPPLPGRVAARRGSRLAAVGGPTDERLLVLDLGGGGGPAGTLRRIVVELMTNQWNILALDEEDRILAALWRREAGDRRLRPGATYQAPAGRARAGAAAPLTPDEWRDLLLEIPPEERARRLAAGVAFMSPINAGPVLGEAAVSDEPGALEPAYARYRELAALPAAAPRLLELDGKLQPYPLPLAGVPGRSFPRLLDAIAALAHGAATPTGAPAPPAATLERLRAAIAKLEGRRARIQAEADAASPLAAELRRQADLLISQLWLVRKGMTQVALPDFSGGAVRVPLDPALAPAENANRLYDAARKRERAAARLPALVARVAAELQRLRDLERRAEAGEADAGEVEAAAAGLVLTHRAKERAAAERLPYRRYRSSGGLEVRVGRSRAANDELTFHHSSPNDIWLHARDVGGAHVVLRWGNAEANPPGRDLAEAAVLAALHSKARTSGTVGVDWTRRKYVRKPRKAPPGQVAVERAKTLFVGPDAALEQRLRWDDE